MTNTYQDILEITKKVLCNPKLYNKVNFYKVPFNKIGVTVIRNITKDSYAKIGKHFNKSWFSCYAAVENCSKNGLKAFTEEIISLVKKEIK